MDKKPTTPQDLAAGRPWDDRPRLRNPGESLEAYRIAMGWDQPAPPAERPGVQDLDPAQLIAPARLYNLRRALGLSVNDMAQRLGLWGANGADNLRQMERGARAVPGTVQQLVASIDREQELLFALRTVVRHFGKGPWLEAPELKAARDAFYGDNTRANEAPAQPPAPFTCGAYATCKRLLIAGLPSGIEGGPGA